MERLTERVGKEIRVIQAANQKATSVVYKAKGASEIIADAIAKLADYEDAEEEGRLVELPCKIGDTIYYITSICDFTFKYCQTPFRDCSECEKSNKIIIEAKFGFNLLKMNKAELKDGFFLTREEAEAKLKEMEADNG